MAGDPSKGGPAWRRRGDLMFVQDFEILDVPFERVASVLDERWRSVIDDAFEGARVDAERLRTRVGPSAWPSVFSKSVDLRLAPLRLLGDCLVLSFQWTSHGGAALFPAFEGELEVAPLGEDQCEVQVRGQYEPPAGALGRGLDRLLFHRVAESTVRSFLGRICGVIVDEAGTPGTGVAAPTP